MKFLLLSNWLEEQGIFYDYAFPVKTSCSRTAVIHARRSGFLVSPFSDSLVGIWTLLILPTWRRRCRARAASTWRRRDASARWSPPRGNGFAASTRPWQVHGAGGACDGPKGVGARGGGKKAVRWHRKSCSQLPLCCRSKALSSAQRQVVLLARSTKMCCICKLHAGKKVLVVCRRHASKQLVAKSQYGISRPLPVWLKLPQVVLL